MNGLHLVPPEEYIYVSSWERLCREGGHLWADGYKVSEVFSAKRPPCMVVTSGCDCGPHLQEEHHPNKDLPKHRDFLDWEGMGKVSAQYACVQISAPVDLERCRPWHKYSMKTNRWTWCTFDDIPGWVTTWYSVNANMDHPKLKWIPFGLNDQGDGHAHIPRVAKNPKTGLCYLNVQDYSPRRLELKRHFSSVPWVTYRPTADLPVATYLDELASHKFLLCPEGNGLDRYAVYEAIYCGVIPVLERSAFADHVFNSGLPVLVVHDMQTITEEFLEAIWGSAADCEWDYSAVTIGRWEKELGC
jgi:hypothetical protein